MITQLTPQEESDFDTKRCEILEQAKPEVEQVRQEYIRERAASLTEEHNIPLEDAKRIVEIRTSGRLALDDVLCFDNGKVVPVREVLASPEKFDGMTLRDPLEPEAGRNKAKFYANTNIIHSMIHGETNYHLGEIQDPAELLALLNTEEQAPSAALNGTMAGTTRRFHLVPANEMIANRRPTDWLIKDFLEADSITTLFGSAESFKTFLALDMGLSISAGISWQGRQVRQGAVVYVCGEGIRGISRRIEGWYQHHGIDKGVCSPFFSSTSPAQLLDKGSLLEIEAAAKDIIEEHGGIALLIVDTLNRNFGPGNENDTQDMTAFITALDQLRVLLGCAILVVHHTGVVDAERSRGSSALRGGLDFEYRLRRIASSEENTVELSCTKSKDHERPPTMMFKPVAVELEGEFDEDGVPITSIILEYSNASAKTFKQLSFAQHTALEALRAVSHPTPDGRVAAHIDEWRKEAYAKSISPADTQKARQLAFNRAVLALKEKEKVCCRDDFYWLAGSICLPDLLGPQNAQE